MKISTRIWISNTLMVFLSLLLLLAIGGGVVGLYRHDVVDITIETLLPVIESTMAKPESERDWSELELLLNNRGEVYAPWFGEERSAADVLVITFLVVGALGIGVIMLISLLFTRRLIKLVVEDERKKNTVYEKARTDMISGISHDLRTPLTSIKGFIKGLKDGVATTPEKQEQYLSIAYQKACYMDVLLERLFYFSKLETGNLPFFPRDIDLGEFLRAFEKLNPQVIGDSHPVKIDNEQMKQVIVNLVDNAEKYANGKNIIVTLTSQGDNEIIVFADNGDGVPPEKLPHLFEQFYRADESRNDKDGSGLGLFIVKYILEAHGGSIIAENDNGLKFTITLPRRESDA